MVNDVTTNTGTVMDACWLVIHFIILLTRIFNLMRVSKESKMYVNLYLKKREMNRKINMEMKSQYKTCTCYTYQMT